MSATTNNATFPTELSESHTLVDKRRNRERLLDVISINNDTVHLKFQNGKTIPYDKQTLTELLHERKLCVLIGTHL